jgi:hypothetical protein
MKKTRQPNKNTLEVTSVQEKCEIDDLPKPEDSCVVFVNRVQVEKKKNTAIEARIHEQGPMEQEEARKPLGWMLMACNMLAILLSCFQNGFIIYAPQDKMD